MAALFTLLFRHHGEEVGDNLVILSDQNAGYRHRHFRIITAANAKHKGLCKKVILPLC